MFDPPNFLRHCDLVGRAVCRLRSKGELCVQSKKEQVYVVESSHGHRDEP